MPGPVFTEGERVDLRTIEREDVDFLGSLWNDVRVRVPGGGPPGPFNGDSMTEYYEEELSDSDSPDLLICAGEEPVGIVSLSSIDRWAGNAELGYVVDPAAQRQGYATEAVRLVIDHAFDQLGLHKVIARVYGFNEASMGLLEDLGFLEEGVHRDERFADGEHADVHYHGVLESEWTGGE